MFLDLTCPPHHQDGEWSGEWSMSTIVAAAMSSDTVASSPADGIDAPLPPHLLNWADPTGCLDNGSPTPARSRVCPRLAPVRLALQKLHVVLIRLREAGSMDTRNRPTSSSPTDPDSFEVAVCTLLGLLGLDSFDLILTVSRSSSFAMRPTTCQRAVLPGRVVTLIGGHIIMTHHYDSPPSPTPGIAFFLDAPTEDWA